MRSNTLKIGFNKSSLQSKVRILSKNSRKVCSTNAFGYRVAAFVPPGAAFLAEEPFGCAAFRLSAAMMLTT